MTSYCSAGGFQQNVHASCKRRLHASCWRSRLDHLCLVEHASAIRVLGLTEQQYILFAALKTENCRQGCLVTAVNEWVLMSAQDASVVQVSPQLAVHCLMMLVCVAQNAQCGKLETSKRQNAFLIGMFLNGPIRRWHQPVLALRQARV